MLRAYALAGKADAYYCKVDVARSRIEVRVGYLPQKAAGGLRVVTTRFPKRKIPFS
jgi:hypothetical protein